MSSTYGKNIRVTIFGESHAAAIGVTIEGLPAGIAIDTEELQALLDRRAPGKDRFSTARKESDTPEFLCGVKDGKTCGTPVTAIIRNSDQHSFDYASIADTPRPGHADYTAEVKYGGFQDKAGGGHFSGRLTAPLCIAGGIALQILKKQGIEVAGRVTAIGGITESEEAMLQAIEQSKAEGDSVGGIVECVATGVPAGLGDPMFDGMENRIASAVFGIPAVKGVEFGEGFSAAALKGSENNDAYEIRDGRVFLKTNHCGGILGGITTGSPIVVRAAFKPTPSIAKEQDTVNLKTMENCKISVPGRHDPCIARRAVPAVEAAVALAILDALLEQEKYKAFIG